MSTHWADQKVSLRLLDEYAADRFLLIGFSRSTVWIIAISFAITFVLLAVFRLLDINAADGVSRLESWINQADNFHKFRLYCCANFGLFKLQLNLIAKLIAQKLITKRVRTLGISNHVFKHRISFVSALDIAEWVSLAYTHSIICRTHILRITHKKSDRPGDFASHHSDTHHHLWGHGWRAVHSFAVLIAPTANYGNPEL